MSAVGETVVRPVVASTDVSDWFPLEPAESIREGSALDVSFLLDTPAGKHGFVKSQSGRLVFEDGTRARFFGVTLIPPTAFVDHEHAKELADRLARSGVTRVS
jgi:hypothetical protein